MRILQKRFADAHKGRTKSSGPKVVVAVDDDGSDEDDAVEPGISTHEQERIHDTSGMDEDLDKDQYYCLDEGTYLDPNTHSKEPDASNMPLGFASSHGRRINVEPAGSSLPAAVTDTTQATNKIEGAPQGAEGTPYTPPIDAAADAALHLPAVPPPTSPLPRTSDTAAGRTLNLPAASPRGEATSESLQVGDVPTKSAPMGHLLEGNLSWQDWENSFTAFKAFFDGGVKILRSVDELLPLCYKFDGYATFQGAFVFPKTVEVLKKFMDKYGGVCA
ncbi:uncharacterized protein LOC110772698 [Prunus avium]|uniref:Uncharacterized protein LOC110772698 n=1 Tax=Prunus avium TaxID=42229 RepID=A0A6P5TYK4_PRUAV|nr:uncharacterized protein LOC110772698 [Prunus avium]